MRNVVLILPKLTEKVNVQQLKAKIHKYVGDRMVEDEPEEMPGLMLKGELSDEDKQTISGMSDNVGIIFIANTRDDDSLNSKSYLDIEI